MAATRYSCGDVRRRDLVRAARDAGGQPFLNGIDFLEVSPADQTTLLLHLIHPAPGQASGVPAAPVLTAANFRMSGGVRVTGVSVVDVPSTAASLVTLRTDRAGDFSTYTLRLVTGPAGDDSPAGFDPMLAEVSFSFKVDCPGDFDCRVDTECPEPDLPSPTISYLAKDYASFRRLILDRLAVVMPDWRERNPADLGIVLVELLAYLGDHLSYYQDAVATEAYLGTARRRTSVRRHARLVDYPMHEGANARAWLVFEAAADRGSAIAPALRKSAKIVAAPDDRPIDERDLANAVVFETMHEVVELRQSKNAIPFYTWGDARCCLPLAATRATLDGDAAVLGLAKGDVLLFEEVLGASSGLPEDADRTHRHAVRLMLDPAPRTDPINGRAVLDIEWDAADALPFPLCLSEFDDGAGGVKGAAVARANVALADHGLTIASAAPGDLIPTAAPVDGRYRPVLIRPGVTHAAPYDPAAPAAAALDVSPEAAVPSIALRAAGDTWQPRRDLLASDRFAAEFVAEIEEDGRAHLRFGDGKLGRAPQAGTSFAATYRVGSGSAGNVGADALNRLVPEIPGVTVRNPLGAAGGTEREPLAQVKLYAPQAFRVQERAVTEADYVAVAERHPDIQRAAATRRWTGSWHTMFVTVDRRGGKPVDAAFEAELRRFLESFRMAGYDLEIDAPRPVPLEIVLAVCVKPGYYRALVKAALLEAFSRKTLPGGVRGFFHPDNFTFGQPVYLSQVIARAMQVTGVESVDVHDTPPQPGRFRRYGQPARGEIAAGLIPIHRLEIGRLDNDPSAPEHGRIDFVMAGGL